MTKEEKHFWYDFLKNHRYSWRRQKILDNYILDFYCTALKIGIELDGSQHYSDEGLIKDRVRTEKISKYGVTIIRISNYDINHHFVEACEYINSIIPPSVTS